MDQVIITIVAPESSEEAVISDLKEIGVHSWTAWTVRGSGEHGVRPTRWTSANVRIDVFTSRRRADEIVSMLARKHPREQSVFVAMSAAQVLSGAV